MSTKTNTTVSNEELKDMVQETENQNTEVTTVEKEPGKVVSFVKKHKGKILAGVLGVVGFALGVKTGAKKTSKSEDTNEIVIEDVEVTDI